MIDSVVHFIETVSYADMAAYITTFAICMFSSTANYFLWASRRKLR